MPGLNASFLKLLLNVGAPERLCQLTFSSAGRKAHPLSKAR